MDHCSQELLVVYVPVTVRVKRLEDCLHPVLVQDRSLVFARLHGVQSRLELLVRHRAAAVLVQSSELVGKLLHCVCVLPALGKAREEQALEGALLREPVQGVYDVVAQGDVWGSAPLTHPRVAQGLAGTHAQLVIFREQPGEEVLCTLADRRPRGKLQVQGGIDDILKQLLVSFSPEWRAAAQQNVAHDTHAPHISHRAVAPFENLRGHIVRAAHN
mmetsp:Transcript_11110/g.31434  ORF Transcript_11110/g.31434 Transcript_11110/m.31434 type:complete len:216 (+) Transcript_11110:445-1092(+)